MRNLIIIEIVLSGSLLVGCSDGKGRLSERESRGGRSAIPVSATIIQPQPLENRIYSTGTLLANEEVELRPEISGRVTGVFFQEGGRVRKGQSLLKINDSELQAQLRRKELEEKLAADEERRKKSLFDISGISREEYDRAVNALEMVRAEEEVIRSQIAETEIVAPFDGIIGLRYVSEGSFVNNNMLAATMQDIDPMKVEFSVPEKYARQIAKGTGVVIRVGENGEADYRGEVYAVESKIDLGTRTIKARATVPNPKEELIPGSFARVEITLERVPNAIVVPAGALIPELAGQRVFVYRDGKAVSILVKVGVRMENAVQITEGLNRGDTLVLTGQLQLSDGREVEIKDITDGQVAAQ